MDIEAAMKIDGNDEEMQKYADDLRCQVENEL